MWKFIMEIITGLFRQREKNINKEVDMPEVEPKLPKPDPPQPDLFKDAALPLILTFEGSKFTNDPQDRGGATRYGVIQTEYDAYRTGKGLPLQSVEFITQDEYVDIYLNKYWLPSKCDRMKDKLAIVMFDTAVNNGVGRAAKILQKALGVTVDGGIGPGTMAALQGADQTVLSGKYIDIRETFYQAIVDHDPTQAKWLNGWLRRLNFVSDYVNGIKTIDQIRKEW